MFCTNCGHNVEDDAVFCTNCGAKIQNDYEESTVATMTEEVPSEIQSTWVNTEFEQEFNPVTPRRSRKGAALGVIAVVLLAVFGIGYLLKDAVFAAIMPKVYLSKAITNTVESFSSQMAEASEWLYGFNVKEAPELTYTLSGTLDEFADEDMNSVGAEIVMAKSDKKDIFALNADLNYDGETLLSANASLDNENIVFDIPKLFKDCLTMPSKDFGKAWNDSEVGEESGVEFDDALDLSYTKLFEEEKTFTEETLKAMEDATKVFVEEVTIENSKGNANVNGKNVTTRKLDVTVPADNLEDYLIDVIKIVGKDDNVTEFWSEEMLDQWEEAEDEICDGIKEFSDYYEDDLVFSLDVYKGKIVKLSHEAEIEEAELFTEIEFKDSKNIINDICAVIEISADGEKLTVDLESKGNHVPEKNVFSDETYIKIKIPYEEDVTIESAVNFNMAKGNCDGELSFEAEDEKFSVSFDGKCSNKKSFELDLEDVEIKYTDSYGDSESIKGSLKISASNKFDAELPDDEDGLNILEADEDDMNDWAEDVEKNAEELAEEYSSEFEELFGHNPFGYSSYDYDDYDYDDYDYDYDDDEYYY